MQVLLHTKYGRLWCYSYEAGKPDIYGNSNEPVICYDDSYGYCAVFFSK